MICIVLFFLQKFARMTSTVITSTQYLSIILLVMLAATTKNVHCQDPQQQQPSTFQQVPLTSQQQQTGTQQQQITTQQVAVTAEMTTTASGILGPS